MSKPQPGEYPYSEQGAETLVRRFMKLCEMLDYGTITVEVVSGAPKIVTTVHQSIRLDLANIEESGIVKIKKANHDNDAGAT